MAADEGMVCNTQLEGDRSFKVVRNGISNRTKLTTWDDMIACGMPKFNVENAYRSFADGTRPESVHLNDDFCKNYGWMSYNLLGDATYSNVSISPKSHIAGERILENLTDQPYTQEIEISTEVTESATTTVTSSSSVSTSSKVTVGIEALGISSEFSQNFTFSNEVGSSSSQSITTTIADKVIVTLPPKSKYRAYLEVTMTQRTEDWEIPVFIDPNGLTGAHFKDKVRGHYDWEHTHDGFFKPPFASKITGTLTSAYDSRGHIIIEPYSQ